jgi:hypothetical protein
MLCKVASTGDGRCFFMQSGIKRSDQETTFALICSLSQPARKSPQASKNGLLRARSTSADH